jgi:hypothetical protein
MSTLPTRSSETSASYNTTRRYNPKEIELYKNSAYEPNVICLNSFWTELQCYLPVWVVSVLNH